MSDTTLDLKLTVYQPDVMAPSEQVGFEYDLKIVVPDSRAAVKGHHAQAKSAKCDVVPVTGTLEFPNPAAPVISPYEGLLFIYDNSPIIAFPLIILAESTGQSLKFNMNLAFPAAPLYFFSGAIMFGDWPGPLHNVTASFLCPQPQ
jgi:hypothetical protein